MTSQTSYTFYPVIRDGIRPASEYDGSASVSSPSTVPVELAVKGSGENTTTQNARIDLNLYGPGDVIGLDRRQIVRTEPEPDTTSFPPNYFPLVEFDRPDLPWLFSPQRADEHGRNRPWLTLVVVEIESDAVSFSPAGMGPLPVVEATPKDELPDPSESWAWAHAQIVGSPPSPLTAQSNRTISRLVCPRNLDPNTRYRACVVPTFEPGRRAGLGLKPYDGGGGSGSGGGGSQTITLAWDSTSSGMVRLPVYYTFEFTTAHAGDFESLVRELTPRDFGSGVGYRTVDVSNPGPEMLKLPYIQATKQGTVGLEGALKSPVTPTDDYAPGMQDVLRDLLNEPAEVEERTDFGAVGPPLYGRWHVGMSELESEPNSYDPTEYYYPKWFDTVNTDPRHRIAAGFGAQVVRDRQQQLMASAWDQLPELEDANEFLRWLQSARDAQTDAQGYIEALSNRQPGRLLQFTTPIHDTVTTPNDQTLRSTLANSHVPTEVMTPMFRKITRPSGDLARRADVTLTASTVTDEIITGAVPTLQPRGTEFVTAADVADANATHTESPPDETSYSADGGTTQRTNWLGVSFQSGSGTGRGIVSGPTDPLEIVTNSLVQTLDPSRILKVEAANRLGLSVGDLDQRPDPIEEVMDAPRFTEPMYRALIDLDPEYLLPGVGDIPADSVGVVETNPVFIEAFMVGLNHEMARELRWRKFPTDRRGTYFRRFWNREGNPNVDTSNPDALADINPLHTWDSNELGKNSPGDDPENVVLLVRGELLQRYPNTNIYCAKAVSDGGRRIPVSDVDNANMGDYPDHIKFPIFRGTLDPDVTFLGFDLTAEEAVGDHETDAVDGGTDGLGWFFVFEEPPGPGETRFGLDVNQDRASKPGRDPFTRTGQSDYTHTETDVGTYPAGVTLSDGKLRHEARNGSTLGPKWDRASTEERGWSALSWGHLVPAGDVPTDQGSTDQQIEAEQAAVDALTYVSVENSAPGGNDGISGHNDAWAVESGDWQAIDTSAGGSQQITETWSDEDAATWGKNSAHMARITLQQPVRVSIHADDMLPNSVVGGGGGG